jgi:DNA-binding transcriptional LysR family regulator
MNHYDASTRLDSELLRSFLFVVRHGSITRAALALHRTQSAVSVQIKRLETALGVTLFTREPRGVSLTPAGEQLLGEASQILAMLDRVSRSFRSESVEGPVTVGVPDDYGSNVLPAMLADFARSHPGAEVSVRCGFSTGFPDAVANDELDLAVYVSSPGEMQGDFLAAEETIWAVARHFALPPAGEALPVVLFDRTCWWRDAATAALDKAGRAYRIACSSESVAGVKAAIAAGLGVGVLARSSLDPGMRMLGPADGFAQLGPSRLVLLVGARGEAPPVAAMAEAIRSGFHRLSEAP